MVILHGYLSLLEGTVSLISDSSTDHQLSMTSAKNEARQPVCFYGKAD